MSESMVDWDYGLSTWPQRPLAGTRTNAADDGSLGEVRLHD